MVSKEEITSNRQFFLLSPCFQLYSIIVLSNFSAYVFKVVCCRVVACVAMKFENWAFGIALKMQSLSATFCYKYIFILFCFAPFQHFFQLYHSKKTHYPNPLMTIQYYASKSALPKGTPLCNLWTGIIPKTTIWIPYANLSVKAHTYLVL